MPSDGTSNLTEPQLVPAKELLTPPHEYIANYYPLQEVQWVRMSTLNYSVTAAGAIFSSITATAVVVVGKWITKTEVPKYELTSLAILFIITIIFGIIAIIADVERKRVISEIRTYFKDRSSK
ncbi:hypothetical protein [Caulobacter sp. BE254]|uniref:hypothetical protein n=1 Tax=Caulobacter sp. BE254 TaxID=2817720 RepID=UPI00286B65F1|nr:hypothetical protein [Caulobacter sp. BE254]